MSDESQKPSKGSETTPGLSLEDLLQLEKFTQKTTQTSAIPRTEALSTALQKTPEESTVPQKISPKPNVLDTFEEEIGGREVLVDNLSLLSLDKKQKHFLYLLCDPKMEHQPLSSVARAAGVSSTAILDLFVEASKHKSQALALGLVANSTPRVIKDIVQKSVDAKVECPECFGIAIEGLECSRCHGRGKILRESSIDHQKLVLETAGILKKGPGVAVQVNQNVGGTMQSGTFFSKFVSQSDQAAYDVEGEIVQTPEESTPKE